MLLERGANVDQGKIEDFTVLDWAYFHKNDLYQMLFLMSRKAKEIPTISGILDAANRSSQALSQYLNSRETSQDSYVRNKLESAMYYATYYVGQDDALDVLLEFGVDPNFKTFDRDESPLYNAAMGGNFNLAGRLLDAGADINAPGVLAIATDRKENFDFLLFLIEQGADVETHGAEALR